MNTFSRPLWSPNEPVVKTAKEWVKINPFLTPEEAQNLAENPPKSAPLEDHDSPLD